MVESELKDIKSHNAQHHRSIPWIMPDIKICNFNPEKSNLSASHTCSLFREHLHIHSGSTFIFLDGSISNNAAEYSAKLSDFVLSYTAELITILFAGNHALTL